MVDQVMPEAAVLPVLEIQVRGMPVRAAMALNLMPATVQAAVVAVLLMAMAAQVEIMEAPVGRPAQPAELVFKASSLLLMFPLFSPLKATS